MTSVYQNQIETGKLYWHTKEFQRHLDFAKSGIIALKNLAPRCYVSLSFGKQSQVLAHMANQLFPGIEMHFLAGEETWMLYDFDKVIPEFKRRFNPNLTIHQTTRVTGAKSWNESVTAGNDDLKNMCPRDQYDGWLWGLVVEESRDRRMTLAGGAIQHNGHPTIFRYADGKYRGCPLMNWGVKEIAAYVAHYDLPMLSIYKKYGFEQRTTSRIRKRFSRNANFSAVAACSPKLRKFRNMWNTDVKLYERD